jgi:hypothetical protein
MVGLLVIFLILFIIIISCPSASFLHLLIRIIGFVGWCVAAYYILHHWLNKLYHKKWIITTYVASYMLFFFLVVPINLCGLSPTLFILNFVLLFAVGFLWQLISFFVSKKKSKHLARYFLIKIPIVEWILYCPFLYLTLLVGSAFSKCV